MNKNIEKVEKTSDVPISEAITEALFKLKKEPVKDGVDLTDIAKKLSSRKFGKR